MSEIFYHLRWSLPIWFVQLLTAWLPDNRISVRMRGFLVGRLVGRCGKGFRLAKGASLIGASELRIGDNVYIARDCFLNTVVKCGVTIGPGTAIGANSAVVSDIPGHVLAAGAPAKVIGPVRERPPDASRIIDHVRGNERLDVRPDQASLAA
jgi:acetyltransferase-like isoleucine patch superfamily enzyme